MQSVMGAHLRVGDTVEVWWPPKRDMIIAIRPYTDGISHVFPHGAQIATFALNVSGMTIDNGGVYRVIRP